MADPTWLEIEDPARFVERVLSQEAPDIPRSLITNAGWVQVERALGELWVDEELVARHDADVVHRGRRDRVIGQLGSGVPIPPLIALGAELRLVDGYARLRALRLLGIRTAGVLVQQLDRPVS